ncbi:MAG: sulfate ABC transporter permease [Elusimicrobia bacterium RIFCSPLOWO2_01_FULL_59_12]|nr:MAG: sulfate ABC transporter permease [Elusimicrobia bacterium RIFCSPLOWO2_01_FULL_59_12]
MQRLLFYASLVLAWFALAKLKIWPPYLFPAPSEVLVTLRQGFDDHSFAISILKSMKRIGVGYVFSAGVGIALGLFTARVRWLENTLGSLVVGLQTLPSICWLPAAILWFGLSEGAILFVVVMGALMAISIGTHDAVKNLPPIYVRAARTMGVRGFRLYREVIFPAALPGIVSGLKQGWSFSWRSLMAGELLFVSPGLGHLLQMGRDLNDITLVAAVMIVIMALGWSVDRLIFSALEQRLRRQRGIAL